MPERSRHAQAVYDALVERVEALGVDLVDVIFSKEGSASFLRILIDKDGGVSLDDCTAVNHLVDPIIDHELKLTNHDYLEVQSPGLERPLKTDRELTRYQGSTIEISLYEAIDNCKKFSGKLGPFTDSEITLIRADASTQLFLRDKVAKIKRIVVFE
ncbi:MAG: ribosome maturation factor RimP [Eubacteriales bacterium]|nr:ribosome maturation factor RimP [Eubacteriales bacterium]